MGKKLYTALAIVALVIGGPVIVDRVLEADSSECAAAESVTAEQMLKAVNKGDQAFPLAVQGVPSAFQDELFVTDEFTELRQTPDGTVVGMTAKGSPKETFERCRIQMEEKGWCCMESGQAYRATFLKEDGAYVWACLDCSEAGTGTAVVTVLERSGS